MGDNDKIVIDQIKQKRIPIVLNHADITEEEFNKFISEIANCNWDENIESTCLRWSGNLEQRKKDSLIFDPIFSYKGRYYDARRISLLFFEKKDVGSKIQFTSKCNEDQCVNPKHLDIINK